MSVFVCVCTYVNLHRDMISMDSMNHCCQLKHLGSKSRLNNDQYVFEKWILVLILTFGWNCLFRNKLSVANIIFWFLRYTSPFLRNYFEEMQSLFRNPGFAILLTDVCCMWRNPKVKLKWRFFFWLLLWQIICNKIKFEMKMVIRYSFSVKQTCDGLIKHVSQTVVKVIYWADQNSFRFFHGFYGRTQMNFLVNSIFAL